MRLTLGLLLRTRGVGTSLERSAVAQQWMAWPVGSDPLVLHREVARAHERFRTTGSATRVRPVIAQSWQRCAREGVDPAGAAPVVGLLDAELDARRAAHPLSTVLPLIRELLVVDATDNGLLVAITDVDGTLLWVEGDRAARARAERMHFVPGACWSETSAGTNAPGTALALDHPVQVFAAEHLSDRAAAWSCTAAPIHDPVTGAQLGALDLTGGDRVAAPHVLLLVRAAVAAVQSELRLQRLGAVRPTGTGAPRTLQVLGRRSGVVVRSAGEVRLGLRHSELLTLLAAAPGGASAEDLAHRLHHRPVPVGTVRAELSRLRSLLPDVPLRSQPYRLEGRLETDGQQVQRALTAGRVSEAVDRYAGPLLPRSEAPGVVALRQVLHFAVRSAVLRSRDPALILRFADTPHSREDVELWAAALLLLGPGSSTRNDVLARRRRLDEGLR